MLPDPRRAEEDFQAELAKVRAAVRMRLGIVAGIVIVGLVQTNFDFSAETGLADLVVRCVKDAAPLLGIAAAGLLVVFGLAQRDLKRARDLYESKRFRVPTRKTRG